MGRPLILVGEYSRLANEGFVDWFNDDYETPGSPIGIATSIAYLTRPGYFIGDIYMGDDQGRVFVEDKSETVPFIGETTIVPAHLVAGDVGGSEDEGKKVVRCWSYLESEFSDWELRIWGGDERAYPPFGDVNLIRDVKPGGESISASELTGVYPTPAVGPPAVVALYDTVAQPKSVHSHQPEREVAGRGFTWEFRFINPLGVKFYGFGGVIEPGRGRRPIVSATPIAPTS